MNETIKAIIRRLLPKQLEAELRKEERDNFKSRLANELAISAGYAYGSDKPKTGKIFLRLAEHIHARESISLTTLSQIREQLDEEYPDKDLKLFLSEPPSPEDMYCLVMKGQSGKEEKEFFLTRATTGEYASEISRAFWFSDPAVGDGLKRLLMLPDAVSIEPVTNYYDHDKEATP